eukprot:TRINITY_DN5561_c2_g2_i1.p1 TRINITY_DN5561_c2_g2~~TRINITY_DN5561_c2_g2_i1.p1  ORF type:complete len:456 (+),score=79.39 TRINITY_DN5561_c2_g2_i1:34-1368(+)
MNQGIKGTGLAAYVVGETQISHNDDCLQAVATLEAQVKRLLNLFLDSRTTPSITEDLLPEWSKISEILKDSASCFYQMLQAKVNKMSIKADDYAKVLAIGQSFCTRITEILVPMNNILYQQGEKTCWNMLSFNYNSFLKSSTIMAKVIEKLDHSVPPVAEAFHEIGTSLKKTLVASPPKYKLSHSTNDTSQGQRAPPSRDFVRSSPSKGISSQRSTILQKSPLNSPSKFLSKGSSQESPSQESPSQESPLPEAPLQESPSQESLQEPPSKFPSSPIRMRGERRDIPIPLKVKSVSNDSIIRCPISDTIKVRPLSEAKSFGSLEAQRKKAEREARRNSLSKHLLDSELVFLNEIDKPLEQLFKRTNEISTKISVLGQYLSAKDQKGVVTCLDDICILSQALLTNLNYFLDNLVVDANKLQILSNLAHKFEMSMGSYIATKKRLSC